VAFSAAPANVDVIDMHARRILLSRESEQAARERLLASKSRLRDSNVSSLAQRAASSTGALSHGDLARLQGVIGNRAVARLMQTPAASRAAPAGPRLELARKCAACEEESMQRAPMAGAAQLAVQRWPFSDEEDAVKTESGGVMGWIDQASSAASDAAGGAVDWAKSQGAVAAGAVGNAANEAVDWAKDKAETVSDTAGGALDWAANQTGSAAGAVTDAAGGAVDWAKGKVGAASAGLLERQRRNALAQISAAQQRLSGHGVLAISDEQLSALNGHLASLREKSNGVIDVSGLKSNASGGDGESTIGASAIGDMLAALQAPLSAPVPSEPTGDSAGGAQRSIQRLMDPATAAAIAAAAAAAEGTAVIGGPVAAVAAPETAGISLVVLAVVIIIVAIVVAIIVYAATRKSEPAPAPTDEPKMPEGLSREKKEKWKTCQELYHGYKKGTGADVGSLASEIKALRGRYDSLTPKEKLALCAKIHQQITQVERLIDERRRYIDTGCDEFDWFGQGRSEDERRRSHEGEINNVKAQEANLRALLKRLQDEGVC